jgi:hypothetical protein
MKEHVHTDGVLEIPHDLQKAYQLYLTLRDKSSEWR